MRQYAELELAAIGYDEKCEGMDMMMRNSVLELIDVFSKQGHSGFSSGACVDLFNRLARFEPLKPIMCTDDEWSDVSRISDTPFFQNKRHSAVFKEGKDARPYYLDAIIWVTEDGTGFTGTVEGVQSRQFIRLPFTPKTFYVRIDSERNVIDRDKLKTALEYYDFHGTVLIEAINEQ